MSYGYWGSILRVDLTSGKIWVEHHSEDWYRHYVGGRLMIAYYLLTEVPQNVDALDPENRLIFAAGPITGIPFPGAGRHSVGAKSPLTGIFGEAEAGGFWGAELKRAGWDGIVISGRASKPTYLWINEDHVELRDASHLWGRVTDEVEDAIREELGDKWIRVSQIGPAGENLVRYALVANDLNEVAGRTGMGAVMGSKLLKAIAVRGKKKVPVADSTKFRGTAKWVSSTMDENHYNFHHFGTGAAMVGKELEGHLIVHNMRDGQFAPVNRIDAVAIKDQYLEKMDGCYACSVRCKKRVKIDQGDIKVHPKFGGPEYETLGAIGTNLEIDDLVALCKSNEMLNYLGMDSISCGVTVAWAAECYEDGLITEEDTGGIELRFGDGKQLMDLIEDIAYRRGFGDLLAEGSLRAARKIGKGTEDLVVHVKGLEIAMHDPRAMEDKRRNYPVTPTGGDHTGAATIRTSNRNTVGLCQFLGYEEPLLVELMQAATGWDVSLDELTELSERGLTMARLFNLREGITAADDRLPKRLHEPIRKGPLSDHRITEEQIREEVQEYYRERGWTDDAGVPTPDTLERLNLREPDFVAAAAV